MMKRSLIAFVTIAALVALASCRGTTAVPTDPPPEPPPVVAAPTLTGGAWVAEEPWVEAMEGAGVEDATTTSYALSGTWRADDTSITKVVLPDYAFDPSAVVEHVKSYRFEDDGDTLVMTHWAEDGPPNSTMRELRYARVPETSIMGSWMDRVKDLDGNLVEVSVQVREDGTFSSLQTVTYDEGDAEVISVSGRYTDDPDENIITLSDVTQTLDDVSVPTEEGMRFAYASGYGDDRIVMSPFQFESDPDTYPHGQYDLWLDRVRT